MIKTAIVALGFSSSTFHLPFLTENAKYQVTTLVSRDVETARARFPNLTVVASVQELSFGDVDLVVITSPNRLHFEQARYCLSHGAHVVVEKPLVTRLAHALALKDLSAQYGRSLVVFQNRRWDGDFLTVRKLIDSGRIGQLKRFTSRFDRFRPLVRDRWREQKGEGAGILWDLGPHLIDQAVALFGAPNTLYADVKSMRLHAEVDDNFDIRMEYPDFDVVLGSSSFQAGPNQRFLLEGDKGTFIKNGLDVQEDALKSGLSVLLPEWGHEPEEHWGTLYGEQERQVIPTHKGNYNGFWSALAEHILERAPSPVPLTESILVIRLIELAIQSAEEGARLEVQR